MFYVDLTFFLIWYLQGGIVKMEILLQIFICDTILWKDSSKDLQSETALKYFCDFSASCFLNYSKVKKKIKLFYCGL